MSQHSGDSEEQDVSGIEENKEEEEEENGYDDGHEEEEEEEKVERVRFVRYPPVKVRMFFARA